MTRNYSGSTHAGHMNSVFQKKRGLHILVAILLTSLALSALYKVTISHLAFYRPVDSILKPDGWATDSWEFVYVDTGLTQSQADRICKTLREYNEFHFRVFNLVIISRKLYNDSELRWNYTGKAQILN